MRWILVAGIVAVIILMTGCSMTELPDTICVKTFEDIKLQNNTLSPGQVEIMQGHCRPRDLNIGYNNTCIEKFDNGECKVWAVQFVQEVTTK